MLAALADEPSSTSVRSSQAEMDVKDWPFKTTVLRGTQDPKEGRTVSRATCNKVESALIGKTRIILSF